MKLSLPSMIAHFARMRFSNFLNVWRGTLCLSNQLIKVYKKCQYYPRNVFHNVLYPIWNSYVWKNTQVIGQTICCTNRTIANEEEMLILRYRKTKKTDWKENIVNNFLFPIYSQISWNVFCRFILVLKGRNQQSYSSYPSQT